ncbi:MAG: hypothetical protein CVU56_29335 [Deltaproteobacteria bacterium HGW-Deltaproteobacteria-14]|nr:MAG: hypothetical protein CVU56_29335 [Deltaproteobacteria bacterium HGW-Deltaproteobacteria-14]
MRVKAERPHEQPRQRWRFTASHAGLLGLLGVCTVGLFAKFGGGLDPAVAIGAVSLGLGTLVVAAMTDMWKTGKIAKLRHRLDDPEPLPLSEFDSEDSLKRYWKDARVRGRLDGVKVKAAANDAGSWLRVEVPRWVPRVAALTNLPDDATPLVIGDPALDGKLTLATPHELAWRALLDRDARARLAELCALGDVSSSPSTGELCVALSERGSGRLVVAAEAAVAFVKALDPDAANAPVTALCRRLRDPDERRAVKLADLDALVRGGFRPHAVSAAATAGSISLLAALAPTATPNERALLRFCLANTEVFLDIVLAVVALAPYADAAERAHLERHLLPFADALAADDAPPEHEVVALATAAAVVGGPASIGALGPLCPSPYGAVELAIARIRARHPEIEAGGLALAEPERTGALALVDDGGQ